MNRSDWQTCWIQDCHDICTIRLQSVHDFPSSAFGHAFVLKFRRYLNLCPACAGSRTNVRTAHIIPRRWGKGIIQQFTGLNRIDHMCNVLRLLAPFEALLDRGQVNAYFVSRQVAPCIDGWCCCAAFRYAARSFVLHLALQMQQAAVPADLAVLLVRWRFTLSFHCQVITVYVYVQEKQTTFFPSLCSCERKGIMHAGVTDLISMPLYQGVYLLHTPCLRVRF